MELLGQGYAFVSFFSSVRCRWLVSKRELVRCENREDPLSPEIRRFTSKIPPRKGRSSSCPLHSLLQTSGVRRAGGGGAAEPLEQNLERQQRCLEPRGQPRAVSGGSAPFGSGTPVGLGFLEKQVLHFGKLAGQGPGCGVEDSWPRRILPLPMWVPRPPPGVPREHEALGPAKTPAVIAVKTPCSCSPRLTSTRGGKHSQDRASASRSISK